MQGLTAIELGAIVFGAIYMYKKPGTSVFSTEGAVYVISIAINATIGALIGYLAGLLSMGVG